MSLQAVMEFMLPESKWAPPNRLPNILNETLVSIDTEGKDPLLTQKGPGWHRKDGHLIGLSIAWSEGKAYFPFFGEGAIDRDTVLLWLKDSLNQAKPEIVMANAQYDLGWLAFHGLDLTGFRIRDIQVAEYLIDEEPLQGFGLDALSKKYLGEHKAEELLRQAASAYDLDPKKDLHKLPSKFVGPYAEADADQTRRIYLKQVPILEKEELWSVFEMECDLIPILRKMNQNGIRVDVEKAIKINDVWGKYEKQCLNYFKQLGVDPWSSQSIGKYCDGHDLPYTRTAPTAGHPRGQPSFTKAFLENSDVGFFKRIRHIREINRIRTSYVERDIICNSIGGRVYPNFLQTACEEGGTRSGRFACKQPNVQQIPKRSRIECGEQYDIGGKGLKLGAVIRSLYLPENGEHWCKLDYSSQEPRLVVHYALVLGLRGAERAREYFIKGKKLYDFLAEVLPSVEYATIKNLYLGRCYGMGHAKMAETIGVDQEECRRILNELDEKAPFISQLDDRVKRSVMRKGYIRTLLGRKRRFNWWEDERGVISKKEAPGSRRAFTNKCLNALIQGSAADQAKLGIIETYKAGYTPLLTLHDEGDWSVGSDKDVKILKDIMENVIKLELPTVCDPEVGPHWTA